MTLVPTYRSSLLVKSRWFCMLKQIHQCLRYRIANHPPVRYEEPSDEAVRIVMHIERVSRREAFAILHYCDFLNKL
jgi:hypothetical protein